MASYFIYLLITFCHECLYLVAKFSAIRRQIDFIEEVLFVFLEMGWWFVCSPEPFVLFVFLEMCWWFVCSPEPIVLFVFLEMGWWFVRSPEPIVAPPGDEVVFECSLNVPAEQVRWRHGGHFLQHSHGNDTSYSGSGNHSNKSSRLVVRVHDEHQAGDYQVWIITALM